MSILFLLSIDFDILKQIIKIEVFSKKLYLIFKAD